MADWVVVDDDETNCKMAGRILSMANMRVTAVKSGYALLEYLRDKTGRSGLRACRSSL